MKGRTGKRRTRRDAAGVGDGARELFEDGSHDCGRLAIEALADEVDDEGVPEMDIEPGRVDAEVGHFLLSV